MRMKQPSEPMYMVKKKNLSQAKQPCKALRGTIKVRRSAMFFSTFYHSPVTLSRYLQTSVSRSAVIFSQWVNLLFSSMNSGSLVSA